MISKKTVETVYEYDGNEKLIRKTVVETVEYKEETAVTDSTHPYYNFKDDPNSFCIPSINGSVNPV